MNNKENMMPIYTPMMKPIGKEENKVDHLALENMTSNMSNIEKFDKPLSPESLRIVRALGIEMGKQKQYALLKHLSEKKMDPEALALEVEKVKNEFNLTQEKI